MKQENKMKKFLLILLAVFMVMLLCGDGCDTTENLVKKDQGIASTSISTKDIAKAENPQPEAAATPSQEAKDEEPKEDLSAQSDESVKKLDRDVIAIVGSYVLTREKYRVITDYMKERFDYKLDPDQEREFIQFIVNKKLMAMEARKLGYAERPDLKTKYEWDFDDILSHVYYAENIEKKSTVTDKEAKEYFDTHTGDFAQIRAQQLFVKSKSMADSLLKRINSGDDFTEITKKYSEDATTKDKGGDMGFFSKGDNFKEIDDVAFTLADGEVSPVIKTVNGYHILKVNERKKFGYDESKDKIKNIIKEKKLQQVFESELGALKKKYKVEINQDTTK
jgi:parvulin-like peptidyl-prolyl isomerase